MVWSLGVHLEAHTHVPNSRSVYVQKRGAPRFFKRASNWLGIPAEGCETVIVEHPEQLLGSVGAQHRTIHSSWGRCIVKASSTVRHVPDLPTWLQSLCLFEFASISIQPAGAVFSVKLAAN